MRYFDYSYLETSLVPADFVNAAAFISACAERVSARKHVNERIFARLKGNERFLTLKAFCEMEEVNCPAERLLRLAGDAAPENPREAEIKGFADACQIIRDNYENIDVRERDILRLHSILTHYLQGGGGRYKTTDNVITGVDASGSRLTLFMPTAAAETQSAMTAMLSAYGDTKYNYNIHPLLLIPAFILDFLCIQPFSAGNDRLSRLLTLLLLFKSGYDAGAYISFEEQISLQSGEYFGAFVESSRMWHENANSYVPFTRNFLTVLAASYKELEKRLPPGHVKKTKKRERVENFVLASALPISKGEICALAPDISQTTVELILGEMLKKGLVKKTGAARSTRYIKTQQP